MLVALAVGLVVVVVLVIGALATRSWRRSRHRHSVEFRHGRPDFAPGDDTRRETELLSRRLFGKDPESKDAAGRDDPTAQR